MTKGELEQFRDLKEEIEELECKIANLLSKYGQVVTDKVRASSKEFPYIETSVKITGIDFAGDKKKQIQIADKRLLLNQRKAQAERLELRITTYINSITESRIRRMMEYKYIEGRTWEEIGRILHCDRTTAEKKVSRYLREHPEEK